MSTSALLMIVLCSWFSGYAFGRFVSILRAWMKEYKK